MRIHFSTIARTLPLLGLLLASVAVPAFAQDLLTIKHAKGETQVAKLPKTVAVLDWATLDTLAALGVEAQGIPKSNAAPITLSQYNDPRFVRAGTLFEPDYEVLKSMKPDLIILGGRGSREYEKVAEYGPTLVITADADDMLGSVIRNTEQLAQIFDRQQEAKVLIDKLQASVKQLHTLSADKGTGLTVLTSGGKMSAFGPGSRFGMIHDVFGVQPAVVTKKDGRHGQSVAYEFLLEANPDWLFVMDRDAAIGREGVAAKQMMDNELVQATTAGAKGQIVYLDPASWYLMGNSGISVMQNSVDQLSAEFSKASAK